MGKGANRLEVIAQQNELLKEQNALLREQNELLRQSISKPRKNDREIFIEDIDRDEMRCGFLVTSHRKKLWNVQVGLIQEFSRICQKHNLRYFAVGGTLLGAVRHKGFIPWDDDVDLAMFRPDYEKLKKVLPQELGENYSLYLWNHYRLESDEIAGIKSDKDLPLISLEQERKYPGWQPFFPLMRIIDKRTTMIGNDERKGVFSGIWIDILCLDPVPPFSDDKEVTTFRSAKDLILVTVFPHVIKKAMEKNAKFKPTISADDLKRFMALPYKARGDNYEKFMSEHFFESEHVGYIKDHSIYNNRKFYETTSFKETLYLPFESIKLPIPAGYDKMLKADYGDWHAMKIFNAHTIDNSADISYKDYFKAVAQKNSATPEDILK